MTGPDRRTLVAGGLIASLGLAPARGAPAGAAPASAIAPAGPPRRVVSLNPCLDVILVQIADRDQIAAISHYARDPHGSTIADIGRTLPFTYGTAEEVIALAPDLVITGRPAPATLLNTLARLNIRTLQFPVPETVADSLKQVREVAAVLGHPARSEVLVGRIEAALADAAPPPGAPRPSALVFMPGGFVSGPGTLMDEMMRRAGLENAATRYGLTYTANLPLERLIADPPQILLSGEPSRGAPSRAERIMTHPALSRVAGDMRRAVFPERLLFCGGPVLIQTAAALALAREAALAGPA